MLVRTCTHSALPCWAFGHVEHMSKGRGEVSLALVYDLQASDFSASVELSVRPDQLSSRTQELACCLSGRARKKRPYIADSTFRMQIYGTYFMRDSYNFEFLHVFNWSNNPHGGRSSAATLRKSMLMADVVLN